MNYLGTWSSKETFAYKLWNDLARELPYHKRRDINYNCFNSWCEKLFEDDYLAIPSPTGGVYVLENTN